MKKQVKDTITRSAVGLTCAATVILCAIFMSAQSRIIYYITVPLLTLCAIVYCIIDNDERHRHISRTVLVVYIVGVIVALCYILYYTTGLNERFSDFEALKKFILDSGVWGALIFIGLTIFQVVVLPIPEAVTILLGVAIYGATWSFILSVIGTIIGALISFILGKVFGRKLCNWMFGEENTEKYAKILGEKGKFPFIIMLLFPAFPDDMLCMIAGITDMTYTYFTIVCLLTRPVMIGITAYLGSGIIPFTGWGIPVWIAIACIMFVAFIVINRLRAKIEGGKTNEKKRKKSV